LSVDSAVTKKEAKNKHEDFINSLPGPRGDDGKYLMTQQEWLDRGLDRAYRELIVKGKLRGIIMKGLVPDPNNNILGIPFNEFIEQIEEAVVDKTLLKFDPQRTNRLTG